MPALANNKKRGSRGQKASRGGAQRSGNVPGKDAFQNVKKRPPPNLPGYEEEYQEYLRQRGAANPPPPEAPPRRNSERKKAKGKAARPEKQPAKPAWPQGGRSGGRAPAENRQRPAPEPVRERKPPKPVNPAKRRRNRRIAAILGIVVLIGAGLWFSFGMLFKIELYSVQGESPYAKEEIVAAFRPEEGDNLFSFSGKTEADKIEEQLPYIEELTIRRRLPSTVVFQVIAAEEKYTMKKDKGYAVLSTTRKVLRFADKKPGGLIEIRGLENVVVEEGNPLANSGDVQKPVILDDSSSSSATTKDTAATGDSDTIVEAADPIELLDTLLLALETSGIEDVNWVNVEDDLNLQFRWDKRITVKLGAKSNLEEKLEFVKVLLTDPEQDEIKKNDKGTLDVSAYPLASDRVWFQPK